MRLRDLATFTLLAAAALAQAAPSANTDPDPARAFFARAAVLRVRIALSAEARQQLRDEPREYVRARMHLDADAAFADVGIKLKGAAGSFRKIDERPGFTVHLGKFGQPHRLHGLRRFHLNNGVQDESRLCEWLGSEVFAAAGQPAPRVAHARVWLDGEDLGLYVLREGFDDQFLRRVFEAPHGNLYDGGFCQDIDDKLEKDAGEGPDDHADLARLLTASREFDPERATRFETLVDVTALVDFMALEALIGHWDGYCQNRNNYRLWCDAAPGRTRFLPHGMDQIFGDAEASVLDHPPAIVASAAMSHPAWRRLYRARLKALLPLLHPAKLQPRLEARAAALQKELRTVSREAAAEHENAVRDLRQRVEARYRFLERHVRAPDPAPIAFRGEEPHRLGKWNAAGETDGIALHKRSFQGTPALHLAIDGRSDEERVGSFRTTALLGRGRYRLLATARCTGVEGLRHEDGTLHGGMRLSVNGATSEKVYGDRGWTPLACEFAIAEYQRTIELRLELKAHAGKAWFRGDSLRLVRVGD